MHATPVEFIEWHCGPPEKIPEAVQLQFTDEFLLSFLENVTKGQQHMEEIGQRLAGFEGRNDTLAGVTIVGDVEASLSAMKGLLARNRVQLLPRATVVIGDREGVLELPVGTTVAKVRARCGVPADWQGILDDDPVADNYAIVRDCRIVFRPSVEQLAADICSVLRGHGLCHQREDGQDWIAFKDLYEIIPGKELRHVSPADWKLLRDEESLRQLPPNELEMLLVGRLRMLSEKELRRLLEDEGIRMYNPVPQRLLVHCGDWCHYLARLFQQQEQVLEAAANPEEVTPITAALKLGANIKRLFKQKQGGK